VLTKYLNQGIVQVGSVFHYFFLFFVVKKRKITCFLGFGKHSRKRFVSQSARSDKLCQVPK